MIDLEKLLSPLAGDSPTGVDLRGASDDATFVTIDDLRREVDPALDDAGGKAANWPGVARACQQALTNQTKDLQLAAWLCEAAGHTEGFAGVRTGFRLIRELLDRYWDQLHPGASADGVELPVRARWLLWLSSQKGLLPSLRSIGLLGEGHKREEWLSWESWLEAQRLEETAAANQARHQEMLAAGAVSREKWNAALSVTPPARLQEELEALRGCESELQALDELCEARFGSDEAPAFVDLRGLLSDIREWLDKRVGGGAETVAAEQEASASRHAGVAARGPLAGGTLVTRQDALVRLREVAEFFRRTEPHSPLSHLIERAVRWGGMSFEELLRDVVKSNDALAQVWETLGIRPPSSDSGA
jgi:type VI secretion system protein ImpA